MIRNTVCYSNRPITVQAGLRLHEIVGCAVRTVNPQWLVCFGAHGAPYGRLAQAIATLFAPERRLRTRILRLLP